MPKWKASQGRRSSSSQRCLPRRPTAFTRRPRTRGDDRRGLWPAYTTGSSKTLTAAMRRPLSQRCTRRRCDSTSGSSGTSLASAARSLCSFNGGRPRRSPASLALTARPSSAVAGRRARLVRAGLLLRQPPAGGPVQEDQPPRGRRQAHVLDEVHLVRILDDARQLDAQLLARLTQRAAAAAAAADALDRRDPFALRRAAVDDLVLGHVPILTRRGPRANLERMRSRGTLSVDRGAAGVLVGGGPAATGVPSEHGRPGACRRGSGAAASRITRAAGFPRHDLHRRRPRRALARAGRRRARSSSARRDGRGVRGADARPRRRARSRSSRSPAGSTCPTASPSGRRALRGRGQPHPALRRRSRTASRSRPRPCRDRTTFPTEQHHGWKFIAFGPDGLLYVPVGAPCNVCESYDPRFASILRFRPDGTPADPMAHGVRNTVGFDWEPGTGTLWFTDNGRDLLGDDVPPDELNRAPVAGRHFGFPACHGGDHRRPRVRQGPRLPDVRAARHALGPHVAAIGMRFYRGTMFPAEYRGQLFIAEHGSWNRSRKVGYRVSLVRVKDGQAGVLRAVRPGLAPGRAGLGPAGGRPGAARRIAARLRRRVRRDLPHHVRPALLTAWPSS